MIKKLSLLLVTSCIALFLVSTANAETRTFIREYVYQASEVDSKISCRVISLEQVKRLLLEELGTYLESHTEITNFALTKDQVLTLTAGIVKTEIINENWDGNTLKYLLRAKMTVDPDSVLKYINDLRKDSQKTRELEELRQKADQALKEIDRLRKELEIAKGDKAKTAEYNEAIGELGSIDIIWNGIQRWTAGQFKEAAETLTEAIKLRPRYALTYVLRGYLYARMGNYDKAVEDSDQAIKLDAKSALAHTNRSYVAYRMGTFKKALEHANKAIELDPKFALAYVARGAAYWGLEDYQKVVDDADKAIELNPKIALAYVSRGAAYDKLGKNIRAYSDVRTAVDLDPKCPEAYIARGYVSLKLNNNDDAIKDFNKAIELDPYFPFSYINLAAVYIRQKNYTLALEKSNKAVELAPKYATAYLNRAIAGLGLGNYEQAINDMKKAVQLGNKMARNYQGFFTYSVEISKISSLEKSVIGSFNSVVGKNYVNDETLRVALNDKVIPSYSSYLSKLESISPQTEELRSLHNILIEGARLQNKGFEDMLTALRSSNRTEFKEANLEIQKAKEKIKEYSEKYKIMARDKATGK